MASVARRASAITSTAVIMGDDPAESPESFVGSPINVGIAINWYRYFYEHDEVHNYLSVWVKENLADSYSKYKRIPSSCFLFGDCIIARLLNVGCTLEDELYERFLQRVQITIDNYVSPRKQSTLETIKKPEKRENILIAELETLLDKFYVDYKFFNPQVYELFKQHDAKQSDVKDVVAYYEDLLQDVQTRDDIPTRKKTNYIKFVATILHDANLFLGNTKKARKPRAKKQKTASQLVAKVEYLKEYLPLKLVSLPPEKIVQADHVWLYSPKYNRLTLVIAKAGETLSVARKSIINFDEAKSSSKRIRKAAEVMKWLNDGTKAYCKKQFEKLNTKPYPAIIRINNDTVIVKAFK